MNWDKDIQNSLDAHLSGLHVSERQQAQMFNRIVRGEQPIMKKKISAALVFAIVMMIAMGSMPWRPGWGCSGISGRRGEQQRRTAGKAGDAGRHIRNDEGRRHADPGRPRDGRHHVRQAAGRAIQPHV